MAPIYPRTPVSTPTRSRIRSQPRGVGPSTRALAGAIASAAGLINPLAGAAISGVTAAMDTSGDGISGGAGVTNQLDKSVQFVSKKRNGSKGKMRKLQSQALALLPKQTLLRNSSITAVTSLVGAQQVLFMNLYSNYGEVDASVGDCGTRDLYSMFTAMSSAPSEIFHFLNARLDATVTNTSLEPTEYDVYEYKWRGDPINVASMFAFSTIAASQANAIGSGAVTFQTRGATPFQFGLFTKSVQILKKTKYLIDAGQAFTYVMNDYRNHVITAQDVLSDSAATSFPYKGLTCGIMLVCKSQIGNSDSTNTSIGCTRTYTFKKPLVNTNSGGTF